MPDTLVPYPVAALILPGTVAYVLAAFGLSFPALISAAVGGTFALMRGRT